MMNQGFSGSTVRRIGNLVEKVTSDLDFVESKERQADLIALSRKTQVLPWIDRIDGSSIFMEYVEGHEGLTRGNARQAGKALRVLHEQQDYPHPCDTGMDWLLSLANLNLGQWNIRQRVSIDPQNYPVDALIHSEPGQFIEKKDGTIVFVDIEGIGMGSRYQDLGFIYYGSIIDDQPEAYQTFIEGYRLDKAAGSAPFQLERVQQVAGIISLAYAGFGLAFAGQAEGDRRIQLGLQLCGLS